MAIIRKSLKDIKASKPSIDTVKMRATTDDEIHDHSIADNEIPALDLTAFAPNFVRYARAKLELSQSELAELTKIPVGSIRNWEQGRTQPDAAASALFKLLANNPKQNARILKTA
jgi:putative transcriptional regulator